MPVHDWTRVEAGIFHAFHTTWIPELSKSLNSGLLPEGFYALPEQHAGRTIADVLTLHVGPSIDSNMRWSSRPSMSSSGTALAEAPPQVRHREKFQNGLAARRRTLAIRHVSGHHLIALIEILSPANKDRRLTTEQFIAKAVEAITAGVHLLVVDLFPPGRFDPQGMHGLIRDELGEAQGPYNFPANEPLTLASYSAGDDGEVFVEHLAVGAPIPEMPLFLLPDRYINIPLDSTYQEAWKGMPAFWKDVLEGRTPAGA